MNMNMPASVLAVATAQKISLAIGAFYVLLGLVGFSPLVMAQAPGQFGEANPSLLLGIFAVNTAGNVVHLLLGALMIWAGVSRPQWDLLTKTVTAVLLMLVLAGFIGQFSEMLAINVADTILHLVTALVFGYFAMKVPDDDFVPTR
jgi:uncharacterized membrane protein